jgi:mono/diheme cytochrome c family protein
MSMYSRVVLLAVVTLAVAGCNKGANSGAPAADGAAAGVTFASNVQPIFSARCGKCHTEQTKGDFSLLTRESILAGGKSGAVVVPGNADGSLLYSMVAGTGHKTMPPKGEKLDPGQLATVKQWIDGGAL